VPEFPSTESTSTNPSKSVGVVILLSMITLFNLVTLMRVASLLTNEAKHGGLDDKQGAVLAFGLLLCIVGLVGIGGAWRTRKWGPQLYLGALVVDRAVALVADPSFFSPLLLIGIALAVVLLCIAESNW
jgi:hypothetical protein